MKETKEFLSVDISVAENNIETPCIICGEGVPAFGDYGRPKVCENCKNAVMKVRDFLWQEHT